MILGDSTASAAQPAPEHGRLSIDDVFRRLARRRPEVLALADAPNRETFTDGAPRRLTYREADRMVTAIAGRLRRMGLSTDSVVGVQMPNVVEHVLVTLGVLRAGMIVAPLPLLWRRADAIAALARVGAKALITCRRAGTFNHSQFAMRVAAEVFSIRYVCGFGQKVPDGVVGFDDLFTAPIVDPVAPLERERQGTAAAHVAAITFDVGADGLLPVARNPAELLAGGLGVLLESRLAQEATILSTVAPSSFAGMALTLWPWLLSGGTLVLHHPFDADVLVRQLLDEACDTAVLPASIAFRLAETGAFASAGPATVIAGWRAPERLATSPTWWEHRTALVDVSIFGEIGLVPVRRGAGGRPGAITAGVLAAPRGSANGIVIGELTRTDAGTVALRGAMVPHHSFPAGAEHSGRPYLRIEEGGLVDTGYTCRVDTLSDEIVVTGAPAGIVSVGGYRFPLHDLQDVSGRIDSRAMLAVLPDPLIGQRLIGNAADRETMQAALTAIGVNPIVAAAFRDRSATAQN